MIREHLTQMNRIMTNETNKVRMLSLSLDQLTLEEKRTLAHFLEIQEQLEVALEAERKILIRMQNHARIMHRSNVQQDQKPWMLIPPAVYNAVRHNVVRMIQMSRQAYAKIGRTWKKSDWDRAAHTLTRSISHSILKSFEMRLHTANLKLDNAFVRTYMEKQGVDKYGVIALEDFESAKRFYLITQDQKDQIMVEEVYRELRERNHLTVASRITPTERKRKRGPAQKKNRSRAERRKVKKAAYQQKTRPVSYTHLTLPTICSV